MIIDCAHYQDGRRQEEGPVSLEEAAARRSQGGFVWLGLFEPEEAELAQVQEAFGLHELAVEDAQNFHMRPKIEQYDGDVRLVILRTARYDDDAEEVEFGEISVFLAPTFVITVRLGVASELREARQRLEHRPELLAAGSTSALWAILDQVVDGYAPVVAGLENDIDQIEATVFSGTVAPTERIYKLRREATEFYRAAHPLLGVVSAVRRAAKPDLKPYLRDVQDHLLLVDEEVAAQRDLLGTVLEANMAVITVEQTKVSVQQNSTIEQLTILATVFLPLTFVTGFFGQNFGWLVEAHHRPGRVRLLRDRRAYRAPGAAVLVAEAAPAGSGHGPSSGRQARGCGPHPKEGNGEQAQGPATRATAGRPAHWGHGRGAIDRGSVGVGPGGARGSAARAALVVFGLPAAGCAAGAPPGLALALPNRDHYSRRPVDRGPAPGSRRPAGRIPVTPGRRPTHQALRSSPTRAASPAFSSPSARSGARALLGCPAGALAGIDVDGSEVLGRRGTARLRERVLRPGLGRPVRGAGGAAVGPDPAGSRAGTWAAQADLRPEVGRGVGPAAGQSAAARCAPRSWPGRGRVVSPRYLRRAAPRPRPA